MEDNALLVYSFFIDNAEVKLLGFPYKSYSNYNVSYDVLASHIEDDAVFLSIDVPREEIANSLSTMYSLPFLGNDIYAVESPRFIMNESKGGGQTKEIKKKSQLITKDKIKFFNSNNLLIEPSSIRLNNPEKVLQEISEQKNTKLIDIVNEYPVIGSDQDKLTVLRSLSRIHELKLSTHEFISVRHTIDSNESSEYIKEKNFLGSSLAKLRNIRKVC